MPDKPTPLNANPDKKRTASDTAIEEAAKRLSRRQIIKDASEYVKKHISRQPPVQRFFSFMPTMLTRVSQKAHQPAAAGTAVFQLYAHHAHPRIPVSFQSQGKI